MQRYFEQKITKTVTKICGHYLLFKIVKSFVCRITSLHWSHWILNKNERQVFHGFHRKGYSTYLLVFYDIMKYPRPALSFFIESLQYFTITLYVPFQLKINVPPLISGRWQRQQLSSTKLWHKPKYVLDEAEFPSAAPSATLRSQQCPFVYRPCLSYFQQWRRNTQIITEFCTSISKGMRSQIRSN